MNLYEKEGINQEELSSILLIDKALTARSVKSLEKKGFVIRKTIPEDRRFKKIFLTDKAKSQKKIFYSILQKWENFTIEGLDPAIKNQIFTGIKTMAEKSASTDFTKLINLQEENKNAIESSIQ